MLYNIVVYVFFVDQGGCGSTIPTLTPTSTVQYLTNRQWPDSYDE